MATRTWHLPVTTAELAGYSPVQGFARQASAFPKCSGYRVPARTPHGQTLIRVVGAHRGRAPNGSEVRSTSIAATQSGGGSRWACPDGCGGCQSLCSCSRACSCSAASFFPIPPFGNRDFFRQDHFTWVPWERQAAR